MERIERKTYTTKNGNTTRIRQMEQILSDDDQPAVRVTHWRRRKQEPFVLVESETWWFASPLPPPWVILETLLPTELSKIGRKIPKRRWDEYSEPNTNPDTYIDYFAWESVFFDAQLLAYMKRLDCL